MQDNATSQLDTGEFDAPQRPQMLNILTILTIVGSSIFLLLSLISPWTTRFSKNMITKQLESGGNNLTEAKMAKMREGLTKLDLLQQNIVPLMIVSVIGLGLCLFGAIMMRKLKKDGFWIYLAGQIIPLAGSFFIMGSAQFTDIGKVVGLAISLLFVVLYTTQRKYLVY